MSADRLPDMLRAGGALREAASQELREQLVRAALVYLARRSHSAELFGADNLLSVAEDFAQEAVIIVLRRIDSFRGQSRLTTWAYTILINLIAEDFRRRAWRRRPLSEVDGSMPDHQTLHSYPEAVAEGNEAWRAIEDCIAHELTARQRQALVGRFFDEKPLIVLAEELGTNKDNVYKLIHDARKHLKRCLHTAGLWEDERFSSPSGRLGVRS